MNQTQNLDFPSFERIETLILASERGDLSPAELEEFDHLIQDDPQARRFYARYIVETVDLISWAACPDVDGDLDSMMVEMEHLGMDGRRDSEMPTPNPNPSYFANACHGMFGFFSQEIPFAMLVATFITGLGLLVGSLVYVTHHQPVAADRTPPPSVVNSSDVIQELQFVGRVTGLDNVQWANIDTSTERGNGIPLGRKYALASGLMELTYDTGAKVILQGPCTYEVDSSDGGYLSVGKLTARVEKKGAEVRGQRSGMKVQGSMSNVQEAMNPKSQISKSQISNPQSPAPMFAVRTPTALVTDLGTEFGVEVDKQGNTTSHVFRGQVELRVSADKRSSQAIQLVDSQSARVERGQNHTPTIKREIVDAKKFVRQMPQLKRVPITLFNTGIGLKEGQADPHWQIVAVDKVPNFKPRTALVTSTHPAWLSNDPDKSQWISAFGNGKEGNLSGQVVYTYRTTFQLEKGTRPNTAKIRGKFIVDDTLEAIRINGRNMPAMRDISYDVFRWFTIDRGFVEGTNVLEFDVHDLGVSTGLRVELDGDVIQAQQDENP